jgi:hypothetical protein
MPTDHILSLLIAERDKLNAAISLLGGTPAKKRGRPPKDNTPPAWVTGNGAAASAPAPEKPARKKRHFSAAQRKATSLRFKRMWRERKAAAKKTAKS